MSQFMAETAIMNGHLELHNLPFAEYLHEVMGLIVQDFKNVASAMAKWNPMSINI